MGSVLAGMAASAPAWLLSSPASATRQARCAAESTRQGFFLTCQRLRSRPDKRNNASHGRDEIRSSRKAGTVWGCVCVCVCLRARAALRVALASPPASET